MKLNDCINFMLTCAQNTVFSFFKGRLAEFDVTPVQYAILKCLWDEGDQYPTQLANMLHLDTSTITGILTRMERKGLIVRTHSETDRRAVLIRITKAGKDLQPAIEARIAECNRDILGEVGEENYDQFVAALRQITDTGMALNEKANDK
ncbi:MAG: MarR family winged helix-turn-helix transcriptional regulator [Oscillospiraceae bacterium]